MRRISIGLIILLSAISLAGCPTAPTQNTASGRPEVTIPGKSAKAILGTISNDLVNLGYAIRSRTEMNAVFEKPLEGSLKFMLAGPGLADPVYRVTLDFIEMDSQTRVVALLNVVTNPGSKGGSPEKVTTAYDEQEHKRLQALLDSFRDKLNASSGVVGIKTDPVRTSANPATAPLADTATQPKTSSNSQTSAVAAMSIAEMQQILLGIGYQPGPADGISGKRTVDALKKFQLANKLTPTGVLDSDTIVRLRTVRGGN